jgi:hypothetical protein
MKVSVKRTAPVKPPIESVTLELTGEDVKELGAFAKRNEAKLTNTYVKSLLSKVRAAVKAS